MIQGLSSGGKEQVAALPKSIILPVRRREEIIDNSGRVCNSTNLSIPSPTR